jgi:hypothetical protein
MTKMVRLRCNDRHLLGSARFPGESRKFLNFSEIADRFELQRTNSVLKYASRSGGK